MCGCANECGNSSLITIPTGDTGTPGATGAQGLFGGFSGEWLFSTSTAISPASPFLRLNNATPSSVTAIYVSDTNADSIDYDAFLDSLSNNSKYGYIRIFKKSDSTKFCTYQITAVVDNGTDHTLTVTYISSNSTFAASDALVLTFSPAGTDGFTVLHNDTTQATTANAAMAVLMSYTLPVNTLATNGSALQLTAVFDTNITLETKAFDIRIGGTVCHTKSTNFRLAAGEISGVLKVVITRQSATTLFIEFLQNNSLLASYTGSNSKQFFETGFSVSDLALNTTLIELRGMNVSAGAELARANQLMITHLKK